MNGLDRRPIVFILDGSGSMVSEANRANGRLRFDIARESLLNVLKEIYKSDHLNLQPGDSLTKVGLIVFGKETKDSSQAPKVLAQVSELKETHLDFISGKLSEFQPKLGGGTPLLEALFDGSNILAKTPGVIVAITDGAYSPRDKQDYYNRLSRLLVERRKKGKEINLHIVGFNLNDLDENINFSRWEPIDLQEFPS